MTRCWRRIKNVFVLPAFQGGAKHYNQFRGRVASVLGTAQKSDTDPAFWPAFALRARHRADIANRHGERIERLLVSTVQFGLVAAGLVPVLQGVVGIWWWLSAIALACIVVSVLFSLSYLRPRTADPDKWKADVGIQNKRHDWRVMLPLEQLHDAYFREHVNQWLVSNLRVPIGLFLAAFVCVAIAIVVVRIEPSNYEESCASSPGDRLLPSSRVCLAWTGLEGETADQVDAAAYAAKHASGHSSMLEWGGVVTPHSPPGGYRSYSRFGPPTRDLMW